MTSLENQAHSLSSSVASEVAQLLALMAAAEVLREEIDAIKTQLLQDSVYEDQYSGERVTEPSDDWHIKDGQYEKYAELLDLETRARYDVEKGYCPALIAENKVIEAERKLIEAATKVPDFSHVTDSKLMMMGMDKRRKYIDSLIGLVVAKAVTE